MNDKTFLAHKGVKGMRWGMHLFSTPSDPDRYRRSIGGGPSAVSVDGSRWHAYTRPSAGGLRKAIMTRSSGDYGGYVGYQPTTRSSILRPNRARYGSAHIGEESTGDSGAERINRIQNKVRSLLGRPLKSVDEDAKNRINRIIYGGSR